MRRVDRLGLALFLLLSLAVAALATRVGRRLEQGGGARLELGRVRPTHLSAHTLERFAALEERVLVTYYVSPPSAMPAAMRRMQLEVTDLLAALRARFPERFDYHVVDPGTDLAGFAARRRVAPFRVRSVTRDAWDERTVWSTLALSLGARPEALLAGLGPEHLPHLQELLVGWLDELVRPRAPRIALAATDDDLARFDELQDALGEHGPVARVDLDGGAPVPRADVLFWMRPRRVTGEQLRGLEHLLATGASVIVAGAGLEPLEEVRREGDDPEPAGEPERDVPFVAFRPESGAMAALAAHFGLAQEPGLVLDTQAEALSFSGVSVAAPHWIRCIAPAQDFHRFASQPNGTLLFRAPGSFTPLPERLAELGWTAEVLATTSDGTWIEPAPPREPVPLASLARDEREAAARQALLVALRADSPWHGELILAAAETPFADGFLHREHTAHPRLLDVLLRETTAPERLVLTGVELAAPEPLPPLGASARLGWRVFGIVLPVLALLVLVHGGGLLGRAQALSRALVARGRRGLRPAATACVALLLVLGLVGLARGLGTELDLTAERVNELAPAARAIAARSGEAGPIEATLWLSEPAALPPALRSPARALVTTLEAFRRAGAPLALERVAPETLDDAARAALAARGVTSSLGASEDDGVTRVARFTATLRLARGGAEVRLAFPDARAFERLEFRLALALERLAGRAPPRIAFASDIPRLSAAEAYEYQKKQLFAPSGTDVFALARASLARNDLEVVHVNPRAPVLPPEADVLVWLQPRRSIEPMLEPAVRTLRAGGRVVIAAQHFKLLSQQFRGGAFQPQLWPRPENPDLENLYFPELGLELVREVLFDALTVPIETESQLTGRQGTPDFERQASSLPMQIRLSSAGFSDHPLVRGLGDQAFLWANRIRHDPARTAALGLNVTPLAFSSPRTWSYAWTGGWIPPELLDGPAAVEKSSGPEPLGPQPLAVLVEGNFPVPEKPLRLNPPPPDETPAPETPWPAGAPGQLVLVGDSSFLENQALASEAFRGDQLLWNLVAGLAFGPESELGRLALRTRATRGFGLVAPEARLAWRVGVIAGGPLVLALGAALLALARRRAAPALLPGRRA